MMAHLFLVAVLPHLLLVAPTTTAPGAAGSASGTAAFVPAVQLRNAAAANMSMPAVGLGTGGYGSCGVPVGQMGEVTVL